MSLVALDAHSRTRHREEHIRSIQERGTEVQRYYWAAIQTHYNRQIGRIQQRDWLYSVEDTRTEFSHQAVCAVVIVRVFVHFEES